MSVKTLSKYLVYWRTTVARDREIVEAVVHADHLGPSPALARALEEWPGVHYWASGTDHDRLVLVRATAAPRPERWWLHALLFFGTFLMAWKGGAELLGIDAATIPSMSWLVHDFPWNLLNWMRLTAGGLSFAMALMGILLAHELGHFVAARRYGIDASPPFFVPAPVEVNFIGTFGAFIRLRSPVVDRRQLMDVGAAGPWVGFVVALLLLVVGLDRSAVLPVGEHDAAMVIRAWGRSLSVGDCLLTLVLRDVFVGQGTVVLDQLAIAGWVGMLVTALNLFPMGQLDGGHIVYALFGDRQRLVGRLALIGLVALGFWFKFWWIWAALALLLGGGRLSHPRVLERRRPLPANRWPLGWASIALFLITFTPVPIHI